LPLYLGTLNFSHTKQNIQSSNPKTENLGNFNKPHQNLIKTHQTTISQIFHFKITDWVENGQPLGIIDKYI